MMLAGPGRDRCLPVSCLAPDGHCSGTPAFCSRPRVSGPLTAPTGTHGRYRYGDADGFPNAPYAATNDFVDVMFRY